AENQREPRFLYRGFKEASSCSNLGDRSPGRSTLSRSENQTNSFPKNASHCPKNASQTILQLCYVSSKRPMGDRVHPNARKAATERCALCRGKLGLGTRFRNIWNGRWWVHIRFWAPRKIHLAKSLRI